MGSVCSAIGRAINSVISAIASVFMAIVGGITSVLVAIWNFFLDIICCRCGSRRRAGGRSRARRY
ncbi:putative transmembrane protein [Rhizoctonia solani 123E]|nr:putative transmembrane protein [Rhizoctonia solani 123E]